MLLNLLTISAFVGIAVASSYGEANTYSAPSAYFIPRHHYKGHHWRSRSSSDSDEKWHCKRLGVFNVTDPDYSPFVSAPKIAYYTQQGKEKAIVVCQDPQIQLLFGKSKDANVPVQITNDYKDNALLSISTKAGLVLTCNKRKERYEALNLFTKQTVPINDVACMTVPTEDVTDGIVSVGSINSLVSFGL